MEVSTTMAQLRQERQKLDSADSLETWWKNLVDPNARRLSRACRHAVAEGEWDEDGAGLREWLLKEDTVPQQRLGVEWKDSSEQQRRMALLHLLATEILVQHRTWTSSTLPPDAVPLLMQAADSLGIPRGLSLDIALELLAQPTRPASASCSAGLLAVPAKGKTGEVMELTVRRLPDGNRSLYPCPAMTLVPRDQFFEQGLENACTYVRSLDIWPAESDISWDLVLADTHRRPLALSGNSGSAAFALAIAKVLVAEESPTRG